MADRALQAAIEAVRRRLHDEIEAQLAEIASTHLDDLEAARRTAEAEAEQRWAAKVDEVRSEWTARLESEVSAVRGEAERRMVAEAMRLRVQAEQAAAESAMRARQEFDHALEEERARATEEWSRERHHVIAARDEALGELDDLRRRLAERERELATVSEARANAEAALGDERRAHQQDIDREEQIAAAAAELQVAERQSQLAVVERLLTGMRSLDASRSLSQVLSALLSSAAGEAPRVALFVMNGAELGTWKARGFGERAIVITESRADLLAEALRRGEAVTTSDTGPPAPAFAELPSDRAAIAVPLLVGLQPVAVLYADDANESPAQAPASWPEAVQILCRHASVNLAHLTAARAADVMRRSLVPRSPRGAAAGHDRDLTEDGTSARRYARLLVSEIKLYNEPAVQMGRENRDLLMRLKGEIERARKLYQERISSSVDARGAFFHQELVQTLADGDPALLGGST